MAKYPRGLNALVLLLLSCHPASSPADQEEPVALAQDSEGLFIIQSS